MLKTLRRLLDRAPRARPTYRGPEGQRIYAIGDIHGRSDLLASLAAMIATDLDGAAGVEALAVFLGDYVDRGPDSRSVLQRLVDRDFPTAFVALRGNHEAMLLDFLAERLEQLR